MQPLFAISISSCQVNSPDSPLASDNQVMVVPVMMTVVVLFTIQRDRPVSGRNRQHRHVKANQHD
jgi:hypothetical protein